MTYQEVNLLWLDCVKTSGLGDYSVCVTVSTLLPQNNFWIPWSNDPMKWRFQIAAVPWGFIVLFCLLNWQLNRKEESDYPYDSVQRQASLPLGILFGNSLLPDNLLAVIACVAVNVSWHMLSYFFKKGVIISDKVREQNKKSVRNETPTAPLLVQQFAVPFPQKSHGVVNGSSVYNVEFVP